MRLYVSGAIITIHTELTPGFMPLDLDVSAYFLDTNVWSSLSASDEATRGLLPWLQENQAIAALSLFTAFELSRAEHIHVDIDEVISAAAPRIYIPLLYDELSDLEMKNYPEPVQLLWNPIERFRESNGVRFISRISSNSIFLSKRQELLQFGQTRFMELEDLKENFPLDEDGEYSQDHAETFAWATTLDFLLRHFPHFLLQFKGRLEEFDSSRLKSLHLRGLFLYVKYYVHGQSPGESDFMDFAHVSYLPYVQGYVTERNVLNVLSHVSTLGTDLVQCDLLHVRSFVDEVASHA